MLELLNMKGKHKHKWDYLREVLAERVVYDDMLHRLWYTDDSMSQGVIFACKQGQVNMDRPVGAFPSMLAVLTGGQSIVLWGFGSTTRIGAQFVTQRSGPATRGGKLLSTAVGARLILLSATL